MDKETFERQELWKAGLTVSVFRRKLGGDLLSYDEAVQLGDEANDTLEHMPIYDVAWRHFFEQRANMFKLAEAINLTQNLGRSDHIYLVNLLVSYNKGKVVEEMAVPILKCFTRNLFNEEALLSATRTELIRKNVPIALFHDLEIVPA